MDKQTEKDKQIEMKKEKARKRRNLKLFITPPDTEEYRLLEEEALKNYEEYKKSKGIADDVVKKEVLN